MVPHSKAFLGEVAVSFARTRDKKKRKKNTGIMVSSQSVANTIIISSLLLLWPAVMLQLHPTSVCSQQRTIRVMLSCLHLLGPGRMNDNVVASLPVFRQRSNHKQALSVSGSRNCKPSNLCITISNVWNNPITYHPTERMNDNFVVPLSIEPT